MLYVNGRPYKPNTQTMNDEPEWHKKVDEAPHTKGPHCDGCPFPIWDGCPYDLKDRRLSNCAKDEPESWVAIK